jgi:hypothetical protein
MNFLHGHSPLCSEFSRALITRSEYSSSSLTRTGLRFFLASLLVFTVAVPCLKATPSSLTNGLIAYYPLNADGTDLSGNRNEATVFAALPGADRFGRSNAALEFNGVNSFLKAAVKKLPFGSAPRSISLWAKAQDNVPTVSLAEWGSASDGAAFGIFESAPNQAWGLRTFGPGRGIEAYLPVDPPYKWHHLAGTYDGTTLTFYRDGKLLGRVAEKINTAESPLWVGVGVNNNFFKGSLDDIRIYDRELASPEVLELAGLASDATWMDSDFDGLSDAAELMVHHTNPTVRDTDGDTFLDGTEIADGTNPLDATSFPGFAITTRSAIELEFETRVGGTNEIQTSSDFKTWKSLETIDSTTNGVISRLFPNGAKRSFYRIHPPADGGVGDENLIGMRLQLTGAQSVGGGLYFKSASTFIGELASGNYTYTESGGTGLLHAAFTNGWSVGDFYDLTLSFSSATSGTFSGNEHYNGTDHTVAGTFDLALSPEFAQPNVAKTRLVFQDDPATQLKIFPALEIGFFPQEDKTYLVQNSHDLETWVTVDTISHLPAGYFSKVYSLRNSDRPYYRVELAPPGR